MHDADKKTVIFTTTSTYVIQVEENNVVIWLLIPVGVNVVTTMYFVVRKHRKAA